MITESMTHLGVHRLAVTDPYPVVHDKPATGSFELHRELLDKPSAITRADAATVLLQVIEDDTLTRTAVNVRGG